MDAPSAKVLKNQQCSPELVPQGRSSSNPSQTSSSPVQASASKSPAPECTVTVRVPGTPDARTSPSTAADASGAYPIRYKIETKGALASAGTVLNQLLNAPLHIDVVCAGQVIGSARLDLLPFATQSRDNLNATLAIAPATSAAPLLPSATVTVSVSFARDASHTDAAEPAARQPHSFVEPADLETTTVIEVGPGSVGPVPTAVATAAAAAGGAVSFVAGVSWPSTEGRSVGACSGAATLADGHIGWGDAPRRTFVARADFLALRAALTAGTPLHCELARYCGNPALHDAAFGNYHAASPLPSAVQQQLAKLGAVRMQLSTGLTATFFAAATQSCATSAGDPSSSAGGAASVALASVLRACPEAAPKAKPLEAALAAEAGGAAKCGWDGAILELSIAFTRAPMEAWQPPPKPCKSLREIVPHRDVTQREEATDATDHFNTQCAGATAGALLFSSCLTAANCCCKLLLRRYAMDSERGTRDSHARLAGVKPMVQSTNLAG